MKLVAILHTTHYRGDHTAEVTRVYDAPLEDSLAMLVTHIGFGKAEDWVELKFVEEKDNG